MTYCKVRYWEQLVGYITIWSGTVVLEVCMVIISLKGTVADDKPREPMHVLIYIKQGPEKIISFCKFLPPCPGLLSIELAWVCVSLLWLATYFPSSELCTLSYNHKSVVVGLVVCNMVVLAILVIFTWCAWDTAGKDWLKLKKYQQSVQLNSGRLER